MLGPELVELFGKVRECGLIGRGVSLGVSFTFFDEVYDYSFKFCVLELI